MKIMTLAMIAALYCTILFINITRQRDLDYSIEIINTNIFTYDFYTVVLEVANNYSENTRYENRVRINMPRKNGYLNFYLYRNVKATLPEDFKGTCLSFPVMESIFCDVSVLESMLPNATFVQAESNIPFFLQWLIGHEVAHVLLEHKSNGSGFNLFTEMKSNEPIIMVDSDHDWINKYYDLKEVNADLYAFSKLKIDNKIDLLQLYHIVRDALSVEYRKIEEFVKDNDPSIDLSIQDSIPIFIPEKYGHPSMFARLLMIHDYIFEEYFHDSNLIKDSYIEQWKKRVTTSKEIKILQFDGFFWKLGEFSKKQKKYNKIEDVGKRIDLASYIIAYNKALGFKPFLDSLCRQIDFGSPEIINAGYDILGHTVCLFGASNAGITVTRVLLKESCHGKSEQVMGRCIGSKMLISLACYGRYLPSLKISEDWCKNVDHEYFNSLMVNRKKHYQADQFLLSWILKVDIDFSRFIAKDNPGYTSQLIDNITEHLQNSYLSSILTEILEDQSSH